METTSWGEVKSLARGKLKLKVNNAGTLNINWIHVSNITSSQLFQIGVTGGREYHGSLTEPAVPGQLRIAGSPDTVDLDIVDVVAIKSIHTGFWKSLDLQLGMGFSFVNSTDVLQFDVSGSANYRAPTYLAGVDPKWLESREEHSGITGAIHSALLRPVRETWRPLQKP